MADVPSPVELREAAAEARRQADSWRDGPFGFSADSRKAAARFERFAVLLEGAAKEIERLQRELSEAWLQRDYDYKRFKEAKAALLEHDKEAVARLAGGERDTPPSTEKWDAVAEAHLATGRPDRAPPSTEGET